MRASKLAMIMIVAVIGFAGVAASTADAKDTKGCEGLGDYRKELFKIGRAYSEDLNKAGLTTDRDPLTYSTDDWIAYADITLEYQRALKKVTPPDWAKEWHQGRLERSGLIEQIARTIASGGIMMGVAFNDQADALDAKDKQVIASTSEACADFAAFEHDWQSIDGEIDGTPVATPTD